MATATAMAMAVSIVLAIQYHIISYHMLHPLAIRSTLLEYGLEEAIPSPATRPTPPEVEVNGRADGRLPIGEARPLHGTTCLGMVRWGFCTIFPWPIVSDASSRCQDFEIFRMPGLDWALWP